MAHKYGGIQFPVPVVTTSGGFPEEQDGCDILLGYLASYIATVLQVYAGDAWRDISPSTPIVKSIQLNEPEDGFNEAWLPALFVYRPGRETREVIEEFDQVADEYRFQKGRVVVRWIMNPVQQANARRRNNVIDAVRKIVDNTINEGRDINWIVPGDPDTKAASFGSSLCGFTGAAVIELNGAAPGTYTHSMMLPAQPKKYAELKMSLLVEELLVRDVTLYGPANTSLSEQITSPDQGTGLGNLTLGDGQYE